MSYPFTKHQPRYGFRRRWGDPHVGIVGSGPGRPLRKYPTDAEVGLPQLGPGLTSLGESPETPIDKGIFNVGPAPGFVRGSFTADPPWALPRYIAATPDGVSGFGAFGAEPKCGIDELVNKVIAQLPSIKLSSSSTAINLGLRAAKLPTSFTITPDSEFIKSMIYGLVGQAGERLASFADKSAGDIAGMLASKVSGPITQKILSAQNVPSYLKDAANLAISKLIDEVLKDQLYKVGEIIRDCTGAEKPAERPPAPYKFTMEGPHSTALPCLMRGYAVQQISKAPTLFRCVQRIDPITAEMITPQQTVTLDPEGSYWTAARERDLGVVSRIAEQQKCLNAGGAIYPGAGAQCDYGPTGKLQNCRVPSPGYLGKLHKCVPLGTPGSKTQVEDLDALAKQAAAGVPKKASNLPLILGAAAIAALVLTRL